jgi:sarcosine oxidase gamma subunit
VTDIAITLRPASPLHALEIWGNPVAVATRFEAKNGFALPAMGRSAGTQTLLLIRYEPTVWLVEGDVSTLRDILADDGAITAIGGGIACIRLAGKSWRTLLMEGGVFDAESPGFAPGCSATTIIDLVNVRLHVVSEDSCDAYVPLSYRDGLLHFWKEAAANLAI